MQVQQPQTLIPLAQITLHNIVIKPCSKYPLVHVFKKRTIQLNDSCIKKNAN